MCRAERIECKYARTSGYLYPVKDTWMHNKTLEKELEVRLRVMAAAGQNYI